MKKFFLLTAIAGLCVSGTAFSAKTYNLTPDSPVIHWYTQNSSDSIQFLPSDNNYYLIITYDALTNGHKGCAVEVRNCQDHLFVELRPGDIALCDSQNAKYGVSLTSKCGEDTSSYSDASGTVQFIKK